MRSIFVNRTGSLIVGVLGVLVALVSCGGDRSQCRGVDMTELLPDTVEGWVRQDPAAAYDRETIFRYINGAGEVYNSYRFSKVMVADYGNDVGAELKIELFDMGNPHDAYGVFSYAREEEKTGIGGGYEQRGSILCFWQDRYYVCVSVGETVEDGETVLRSVARALSNLLPAASEKPDLVGLLPTEGLVPHSDRFFHVQATLNYNYYVARENLLRLGPETDAVLARYAPGSTYLVIVRYASETAAAEALDSFRSGYLPEAGESSVAMVEDGKFVSSRGHGRYVVLVLDAVNEEDAARLTDATLDKIAALIE